MSRTGDAIVGIGIHDLIDARVGGQISIGIFVFDGSLKAAANDLAYNPSTGSKISMGFGVVGHKIHAFVD